MAVGPSGDIAPCHRFVDSDEHALGHVATGIDRAKQEDFLNRGHIGAKYDCHTCWARPSVPADAITKHLCVTATPATPISTTATGSGTGLISACKFTARSRHKTRHFLSISLKGRQRHETSAGH